MDVWLIESGDFPSDRIVWGVASSAEAAAKLVRDSYTELCVVEWGEPRQKADDHWTLTGQCDDGPQSYDFTRFTIDKLIR